MKRKEKQKMEDKKLEFKQDELEKYFPGDNDVLCPITLSKNN